MVDRLAAYDFLHLVKSQEIKLPTESIFAKYNIIPSSQVAIITNKNPKQLQLFTWGLLTELSNNKNLSASLFNLSISKIAERPAELKMVQQNRCAIPVNGFYKWKQIGKKKLVPYYFYLENLQPLWLAGTYEESNEFSQITNGKFRLLTQKPTTSYLSYPGEMPFFIPNESLHFWLDSFAYVKDLSAFLLTAKWPKLQFHSVTPMITKMPSDEKKAIEPFAAADQFGNFTLFG